MAQHEIKVYYHSGFTGRSQPALFILEHVGAKYVQLPAPLPNADPSVFAPPCIDDNGFHISQTAAVSFYLGKKFGLLPEGHEARAIQIALNVADIWSEAYGARKGPDRGVEYLKSRHGQWLNSLEGSIKGKYFFGDHISFVDCNAANLFDVLEFIYGDKHDASLHHYPKLTAWWKEIKALPAFQTVTKTPVLYSSVRHDAH